MIWGLFGKKDKAAAASEEKSGVARLFEGLSKSSSKLADGVGAIFTKQKPMITSAAPAPDHTVGGRSCTK